MASSSSSSSSSTSQMMKSYDVFINFRGSDIHDGFVSHLLKALAEENVDTFVDEELNRGENISSSLLEIIEGSYISVAIFSENYADSEWCLDELVKIVECKNTMGQIVIPVFYCVDPTNVQELSGSFGDALAKHRQDLTKHSLKEVESWSQALQETATLSGFVSQNIKSHSKLIEEIVDYILEKLNQVSSNDYYNDGLVGIDFRVKCVESLLCLGYPEVRVVGIWGLGGIGKTTIANKIFDQLKDQFTSRCFVANVRQNLENSSLDCLQNEILDTVLGKKFSDTSNCFMSSSFFRRRIARRKVLIVLDDVSDSKQIELLIGKYDIYGPGSRIIITSRDKQVLRYGLATEIYEVEALNNHEALLLFCLHAFRQSMPKKEYKALVDRAVEYAQGNPLALKVLASNLYNRSADEWEDELEKLKDKSDEKIGKILRISYDGLCKIDKEIFLDIACLFNGEDKDHVMRILDMAASRIGISRLCEKSLISISKNKLFVHDLLQQMARDIICKENQLGKRSILEHHKDICDLLTKDEGNGANKGISLDMSKIRDIQLIPTAFERMYNLRYLMFGNSCSKNRIKVHLPSGLTLLPIELRLLHWEGYPLNSLSPNSFLEYLVELRMPHSQLKELWNEAQLQLANLKLIDLSYSKELSRFPDFSKTPNVESLNLRKCINLHNVPEDLGNLKSLQTIDLRCTAIEELPESIYSLRLLKYLDISHCRNLHTLPDALGNLELLEELWSHGTGIKQVPSSINKLQKLTWIRFEECKGIIFPALTGSFPRLKIVGLACCEMSEFPDSLCCLPSLEALYIGGNNFESIPESIKQLSKLDQLDLRDCKRLEYLPELPSQRLHYLCTANCTSLKSVFSSFQLLQRQQKLIQLGFGNCINLDREEYNQIIDHAISTAEKDEFLCKQDRKLRLCIPGSEVPIMMKYQNKIGSSLYLSFSSTPLKELELYFCAVFEPQAYKRKANDGPRIGCEAIFREESGQCSNALTNYYYDNDDYYYCPDYNIGFASKHVFLWRGKLKFRQSEKENVDPGSIQFHFFCSLGAITGCGICPLCNVEDEDEHVDIFNQSRTNPGVL